MYESSIAFGIRKALQAEQGKTDMENYIAKLEEEKAALEKEVKYITIPLTYLSINLCFILPSTIYISANIIPTYLKI